MNERLELAYDMYDRLVNAYGRAKQLNKMVEKLISSLEKDMLEVWEEIKTMENLKNVR